MYKENGRLTPMDKKEKSKLAGKVFKCSECGRICTIKNVEFGEVIKCTDCSGLMAEYID